MSVILADRSFQYPIRIAENMLVEVGKFTFPADFIILKIEEDSKEPLILGRPFLHTLDVVIRVKQKQLNLGVGTEQMIFNIDSTMKHSYSNDDTCFSIDVIDELLEKDFDSLLDEGSFYQRFIKDFSKIACPLTKLLEKDNPFEFNDECHNALNLLKEKLTCAPMIISPNWNLPFKLMCDASDFAVGAVLEFDIEIKDKKGIENVVADHLSWIEKDETSDDSEVDDNFPRETLMEINTKDDPWFADFANYLEPYLFKVCFDGMIRRCVSGPKTHIILDQCHHGLTGGHYGQNTTAKMVIDSGFYWPTIIKEAHTQVHMCEACQKTRNISKRDEMPLNSIQVCEMFNIWGIDFMGPFLKSYKFEYILVAVDYVSKWDKAQALPTNDARVVITFLKKLFYRFGMPKALISDRGTHFCNKIMEKTMKDMELTTDFLHHTILKQVV
ncbi:reverse transcriptase domain-containing protein [Tanacetum coccineum]